MEKRVLTILKPKVSAFGFDKNEVKSIAQEIANNLVLAEDATDDDIDAAINEKVDAVLPYLKLAQSQAQRVISDFKKKDEVKVIEEKKEEKVEEEKKEENLLLAELAKSVTDLKNKLSVLESEKVVVSRKSKLEKLLKDSGAFGKSTLRNFERMKFEKDEDFDNFYAEVEEDLKSFEQEQANDGLDKLGPPKIAQVTKGAMDEAELDSLAESM